MRATRVRIDRFSQGSVPTALFDEEPWYSGQVTTTLELRNPEAGEVGLVLLLLKDLLTGDMPIGGSSGVGRGAVTGTGVLHWTDGTTTDLSFPVRTSPDVTARLTGNIQKFWDAAPLAAPTVTARQGASI